MPIRVLVVDDSALMRELLTDLLKSDPRLSVVGTAADPLIAREKIKQLNPDVITLDIEMPRMDGLEFLQRLMALRPMPVVIVSTLTQKGADTAVRALELGACDYVAKPLIDLRHSMQSLAQELVEKVVAASQSRPQARLVNSARPTSLVADPSVSTSGRIVTIGASTGGVEALQTLLTALPATSPAILVTQHMPAGFSAAFANRLNDMCKVTVSEATEGRRILPGHVLVAPGGRHLEVRRSGAHYDCHLHDRDLVSGHRPSVDVLMMSAAAAVGRNCVGVILTGMGQDGAEGMVAIRNAGGRTFGQDEKSCLIYGMPRAAKLAGGVEVELNLTKLPEAILAACAAA